MPYDRNLADRVRDLVAGVEGVAEQRMFGGVAFLLAGNMAVAASGQGGLLVRADPTQAGEWIDGERVTPMVMRGKEMRGWLQVAVGADDPEVELWVGRGLAHARTLPPK